MPERINARRVHARARGSWEKNWPEAQALVTGGFPGFVLSRRPAELRSEIPVFCYHLVDPEDFEKDLEFLARNGYTTIDAETLLAHMNGSRSAPPRSVVLTIDDGAKNLFTTAFPLLQRYAMKAVAFIAPGLHPDKAYASPGEEESKDGLPCTWSEIQLMQESGGFDLQAHTLEHRYVPRWPEAVSLTGSDPQLVDSLRGPPLSMKEDFSRAREILEERLRKSVRHLAFPKFKGTAAAMNVGEECGFRAFWWGYLPGHQGNRPGRSPRYVARIDAIYLRRLPGHGRISARLALEKRLSAAAYGLRG